jgi:hypothetical protein
MALTDLERIFIENRIDYAAPGFYDLPAFRTVEQKNPQFLELYSEYVDARPYADDYLARVRQIVPRLGHMLFAELQQAQRVGACVDISGAFVRMLEVEQVWAYAVGGGITVNFPTGSGLPSSHFGVIAPRKVVAGHMWVRVPPFWVVDITLPLQNWSTRQQVFLKEIVMEEETSEAAPTVWELIDVDLIEEFTMRAARIPNMEDVRALAPHVFPFMEKFPAYQVHSRDLTIKYVPTKIGASEETLYGLVEPKLNGKSPGELYTMFRAKLRS